MSTRSPTDNHGLVRPWERDRSFHLATLRPSSGAERIIDRHWMVRWDLRGREPAWVDRACARRRLLRPRTLHPRLPPRGRTLLRAIHGRGCTRPKPSGCRSVAAVPRRVAGSKPAAPIFRNLRRRGGFFVLVGSDGEQNRALEIAQHDGAGL